jgi:hypothetical protein
MSKSFTQARQPARPTPAQRLRTRRCLAAPYSLSFAQPPRGTRSGPQPARTGAFAWFVVTATPIPHMPGLTKPSATGTGPNTGPTTRRYPWRNQSPPNRPNDAGWCLGKPSIPPVRHDQGTQSTVGSPPVSLIEIGVGLCALGWGQRLSRSASSRGCVGVQMSVSRVYALDDG